MKFAVVLSLEAVADVLRITIANGDKSQIIEASKRLQESLQYDPMAAGKHLSEGLYYMDCEPLRGYYVLDESQRRVEIVNVKSL